MITNISNSEQPDQSGDQQQNDNQIDPQFNFQELEADKIKSHLNEIRGQNINHQRLLEQFLKEVQPIDFIGQAISSSRAQIDRLQEFDSDSQQARRLEADNENVRLNTKHYAVLTVENLLKIAKLNNWGLCEYGGDIYLFNGAYWEVISTETFQRFLGESAEKMGVDTISSQWYRFRETLLKQFYAQSHLEPPNFLDDSITINLMNGTYEISSGKNGHLRNFNREDFLTYQLPFKYDPEADAPIFKRYLDRVLPDESAQNVVAEFLGYVFVRGVDLKLEKALFLHGSGANGKSVLMEIVNALLGSENVSSFSLQELTGERGYHRAALKDKLVNYASEIGGRMQVDMFKKLVSGEIISARHIYEKPFYFRNNTKLIFNANDLPKDSEQTRAYFRRFIIIPFDVTIPEDEQDPQLHEKIISKELPGVFNWTLQGLNRLLNQRGFSSSSVVDIALEQYKLDSDSVKTFMYENGYESNNTQDYIFLDDLYSEYESYCENEGRYAVSKRNLSKRLKAMEIRITRKSKGMVVHVSRIEEPQGNGILSGLPF